MGLFSGIVGGLLGVKKPKAPAFDAGLDDATKIKLQNEADAFVDVVTKYKDQPDFQQADLRINARERTGGRITVKGLTAAEQRQRDVLGKYRELAEKELANPTPKPAAGDPAKQPELTPPSTVEAENRSRQRLVPPSSRIQNRTLTMAQIGMGLARRQSARATNVIGR